MRGDDQLFVLGAGVLLFSLLVLLGLIWSWGVGAWILVLWRGL